MTAGARYQDREVDYVHGRYLENGAGAEGLGGIGAGTPAGNCCTSAASGTWLYYQDPGYARIPYSTPQTNPNLLLTYNNFANGPISVKNPVTGGMTDPATYLNTVWNQAGIPNNSETFFKDALNSYTVTEKTTSAFIMGDSGDEGGLFHANFGMRIVRTQLTVDGAETNPNGSTFVGTESWNGVNANDVPFENSRSYTDILPSFNFVLNATDTQKLRFGAARVMSPQNLQELGARSAVWVHARRSRANVRMGIAVCFKFDGGSAGNSGLDPFRASQFDISWEDYFSRSGLVSVGYFYKAVDNFVTTANVPTAVARRHRAGERRPTSRRRSTAAPARSTASSSALSMRSTSASASRRTTRVRTPHRRRAARSVVICRFPAYPRTRSMPSSTTSTPASRRARPMSGATPR